VIALFEMQLVGEMVSPCPAEAHGPRASGTIGMNWEPGPGAEPLLMEIPSPWWFT